MAFRKETYSSKLVLKGVVSGSLKVTRFPLRSPSKQLHFVGLSTWLIPGGIQPRSVLSTEGSKTSTVKSKRHAPSVAFTFHKRRRNSFAVILLEVTNLSTRLIGGFLS